MSHGRKLAAQPAAMREQPQIIVFQSPLFLVGSKALDLVFFSLLHLGGHLGEAPR